MARCDDSFRGGSERGCVATVKTGRWGCVTAAGCLGNAADKEKNKTTATRGEPKLQKWSVGKDLMTNIKDGGSFSSLPLSVFTTTSCCACVGHEETTQWTISITCVYQHYCCPKNDTK